MGATSGFSGLEALIREIKVPEVPAPGAPSHADTASQVPRTPAVLLPWEDPNSGYKLDRDAGPKSTKFWLIAIVALVGFGIYGANSDDPASAPAPIVESAPPLGSGQVADVNELAYCLAEGARIDAVKPEVDGTIQSEIDGFNSKVSDYNARCAHVRYYQPTMDQAQSYLNSHRQEIAKQADSWLSTWRSQEGAQ